MTQTNQKIPPTNEIKHTTSESSKIQGGMKSSKNESVGLAPGKTPNTNIPPKKQTTKKIHALDVYIIFCFICIIIYTVVHTMIFYKTGIEAVVLDGLFYGVFGGEVLLCALLKRLKLKQEHELVKKQLDDINIEEVTDEE